MAKVIVPPPAPAQLSQEQMRQAIPRIQKRIDEFTNLNLDTLPEESSDVILRSLKDKTNDTLMEIFGHNTIEFKQNSVGDLTRHIYSMLPGHRDDFRIRITRIKESVATALGKLNTVLEIFQEKIGDDNSGGISQVIRAYKGLELHPEIARRASKLYLDGHYADAVVAAVKALNGLVRLRSELELDGSTLMDQAFSPKNPKLKFNSLTSQSDLDEQRGYMMMFSGAVAGLRNPRAHDFVNDDPEQALEFIAFVSLLAKLLDRAMD